jgi:protein-ribulosamine 3-kinase
LKTGGRQVAAALAAALGRDADPRPAAEVPGGCINHCVRWETAGAPVFVKLAAAQRLPMFEAERDGLDELRSAGALRVPKPLALGVTGDTAWLALEWIDLSGSDTRAEEQRKSAQAFGLGRDNNIGSTPQPNGWCGDWVEFLARRRIGYQLDLAASNEHGGRLQERGRYLVELMTVFFSAYRPVPSLLHGDLWGGNWGVAPDGEPVIFDPAVYYGDREADIAMTRLFGGFGPRFHSAYVATWPLDQAAGTRRDLYNLYHVLNHLNLFGGSYRQQAETMIDRLLAAAGH